MDETWDYDYEESKEFVAASASATKALGYFEVIEEFHSKSKAPQQATDTKLHETRLAVISGKELEARDQERRPLHVGGQEEAEGRGAMAQVLRAAARHGGGRLLQTEPARRRRRLLLHELQHVVGRLGSREGGQSATHRHVPPSESYSI